jgi:hypothetical protein
MHREGSRDPGRVGQALARPTERSFSTARAPSLPAAVTLIGREEVRYRHLVSGEGKDPTALGSTPFRAPPESRSWRLSVD